MIMKIGIVIFITFLAEINSATLENEERYHPRRFFNQENVHKEENVASYWQNIATEELKKRLETKPNENIAKNVIMFLGDGMSIPTLAAARVLLGDENKQLSFEKFPYVGLSKTYCVDTQTADSACTATAYLCGVKGNYATIGVTAEVKRTDCETMANDKNHVSSIAQWAQKAGKATGIVTTTRVTHASPAGAYARTAERNWESDTDVLKDGAEPKKCPDIAEQLVNQNPGMNFNVIMGGGRGKFLSKNIKDDEGKEGSRTDDKNLIEEWKNRMNNRGNATYVWNREQLMAVDAGRTDYLLGLFESSHCLFHLDVVEKQKEETEPTLADMVSKAIDVVSKEEKGFFLFVEGGLIDHAHHITQPQKALDETVEFSKAIEMAISKTNQEDTLIVVTSDHAHTMSISGYAKRGNDIFGVASYADDKLPIATLSYANGPGYSTHVYHNGGRKNYLEAVNTEQRDFMSPALAPLDLETHGADDVAVFASGPWAHLFTGNYEQNAIPHMMAYAACIGDGLHACQPQE